MELPKHSAAVYLRIKRGEGLLRASPLLSFYILSLNTNSIRRANPSGSFSA